MIQPIKINLNPIIRKIAFKSSDSKPIFSDLKEDMFLKSNPVDTLNDSNPAYALRHETSEIDYDKFKVDFKKVMKKEFKGNYKDLMDIPIPGISKKYRVVQDAYMIGFVHLLIVPRGNKVSFAECQKEDGDEFQKTIEKTIKTLKKMYPDRNVYFAEHGSGIIEDNKQVQAGSSISHAHGHFLIPFKPGQPPFDEVVSPFLDRMLARLNWNNLEDSSMKLDKVIPDYKNVDFLISDKLGQDIEGYPYLHIGVFDKDGSESSKIYIKSSKENKVPSQILRLFYHTFLSQNRHDIDRINWDWKLASKYLDSQSPVKPKNEKEEINRFLAISHNSFISDNRIRFWVRFLEYLENKEGKMPEYPFVL